MKWEKQKQIKKEINELLPRFPEGNAKNYRRVLYFRLRLEGKTKEEALEELRKRKLYP